jgi:hypothetical protein
MPREVVTPDSEPVEVAQTCSHLVHGSKWFTPSRQVAEEYCLLKLDAVLTRTAFIFRVEEYMKQAQSIL